MIQIKNLTLRRGVKVVLKEATVTLNPGEKVGLVGRNGAGKSSLFSLIAGRLQADAGDFDMPAKWRLGQVAQEMPETEQPATDFVLDGDLGDGVEKLAVVADHDHQPAVALEPVLQPDQRVQVEVVGGLVEQHQVGRAHQRPGQLQPHAPAARKAVDG